MNNNKITIKGRDVRKKSMQQLDNCGNSLKLLALSVIIKLAITSLLIFNVGFYGFYQCRLCHFWRKIFILTIFCNSFHCIIAFIVIEFDP